MNCPYCNRNRWDEEAYNRLIRLLIKHNCISTTPNPGGRVFEFENKRIQVVDMCRWCDFDKLKIELGDIGYERD